MATLAKQTFIADTLNKLNDQIRFVDELMTTDESTLHQKKDVKSWNALECVDHMNKAMRLYTDQMAKLTLPNEEEEKHINIGWKGRFFAKGMRPKGEKISYKMPTTTIFIPDDKLNKMTTLSSFKETLVWFSQFVSAGHHHWKKAKVVSALGPLVKFTLAEAIHFLLAHNDRHILQAKKAMNE